MDASVRPYPGFSQHHIDTTLDEHRERLNIVGYSVLEGVLPAETCAWAAQRMGDLWAEQEREFGIDRLEALGELGTHRGLLRADAFFLDLAIHPVVLHLIESILGDGCILHLQNGAAAAPSTVNFQSRMHRDFAKDFVASTPLSLNAFWCISDFRPETGATQVVPYSHRMATVPSEAFLSAQTVSVVASAGSVIFFDSMLLHRTGFNATQSTRFGINHMYTKPFVKQQVDYPVFLADLVTDRESKLAQKLGFWTVPPKSVAEFRVDPEKRTYRGGQG